MTKQQVGVFSQKFLQILPPINKQELLDKLKELGMECETVKHVYIKYMEQLDQENTIKKLAVIRMYMREGYLDKALLIAKGVM